MQAFSDFNIKPKASGLQGDKIKIERLYNREITVLTHQIEDSKFADKGSGKCLYLQIELNGTKHVVFTGSKSLMDLISSVPKDGFPFKTIIVKENERIIFT